MPGNQFSEKQRQFVAKHRIAIEDQEPYAAQIQFQLGLPGLRPERGNNLLRNGSDL